MDINHYSVLGLPSGEEGSKLSQQEIKKAYLSKAIELHPDKRLDNPDDAHSDFIKLQNSFDVLKDANLRKLFDELLRMKKASQKLEQETSFPKEEEIIPARSVSRKRIFASKPKGIIDKAKVIRVSWVGTSSCEEYTAERLRMIFEKFGMVVGLAVKGSGRIGLALVLMASKDSVVAAVECLLDSRTLLVLPLDKIRSGNLSSEESLMENLNKASRRCKEQEPRRHQVSV